ncbi:MAG TPA: calcium-binding protein [Allosphingosinicella sp.]|nr:calcium-binding protein [Allosphingosinicella sp.]
MPDEFDPLRYIASYGDLIEAFGADAEAGRRHWEQYGQFEGRDPFLFDPLIYGASHGDLIQAFGTDTGALTVHYINYGYHEGRDIDLFDPEQYVAANVDLRALGFGGEPVRATIHYIETGFGEGRATAPPEPTFDALRYIASYSDLIAAFGTDENAGFVHWRDFGQAEGRDPMRFDPLIYGASNPDVASAYGADTRALTTHYINHGFAEGRETTGFSTEEYLALNPDLAALFADDPGGAVYHYLLFGVKEGRLVDADQIVLVEDTSHTLTLADFDGDISGGITIISRSPATAGTLVLGNSPFAIADGTVITYEQIADGMLVWLPAKDVYGPAGNAVINYEAQGQTHSVEMIMNGTDYFDSTLSTGTFTVDPLGARTSSWQPPVPQGDKSFTLHFATTPTTVFEDFNVKRIGQNLEYTWTIDGQERSFVLINPERAQDFDTTFGGGSIAGYPLVGPYKTSFDLDSRGMEIVASSDAATSVFNNFDTDLLFANGGDDSLEARAETDFLKGGLGDDRFRYVRIDEPADFIFDFTPGEDKLEFEEQLSVARPFRNLDGPLTPDQLVANSNPQSSGTKAQFLYDTDDGRLFFDQDGAGASAAVHIVTLYGVPPLTTDDFIIV